MSDGGLNTASAEAPHNNLRISRILKCMSEFGLERFNAGFLLFVLAEQSEHQKLLSRMLQSSMDKWWANCIRDDEERKFVNDSIARVRARVNPIYLFSEDMYRETLRRRRRTGSLKA